MDSLLKHMVDLTGHRDHTMLDISVISAVQELAGAAQTRVLSLVLHRNEIFVRPRAIIKAGSKAKIDDVQDTDQLGESIQKYPILAECIALHQDSTEQVLPDGTVIIWLPIWLNDKVTVCLEITNPTPYTPHTLQVVEGIVSVYRNFQNLLDYSERDSLTGLLNRKTFDDQLAKMLAAGHDTSISTETQERRNNSAAKEQWLAVIDIDHFKRVNDVFGHIYGDEVLILIANLMQSSFRTQDRIFRFGGEEFVVLLRATTLENAKKVVERFRLNVENYDFPQVGRITISLGFAHISGYESSVVILGHADQALYFAKTHGRNQVCHYDELVEQGLLQAETRHDDVEFF
ncbi:MAG: GGDEF domain-containing protein [Pseudomonadota bacterium]